jgi:hypothetical protein
MKVSAYIAIAIVAVSAIIAAAFFAGLFPTNSGVYMPKMSLSGATVESDSSIKATFSVVEIPLGISNYSVVVGVNESSVAPVQFDDDGKAIVKYLDDSANSSTSSLLGIEFSVQFFDKDGDGRVSEGDYVLVTCSEPLRSDSLYGVTVIDRTGPYSSVSCRT